jgi:FtsZ-binding cell division protein ZapB
MNEQTQNVATALKWCQDENQKLRQEIYDLKHDKEVLEARNDELEEEVLDHRDSYNLQVQSDTIYYRGNPLNKFWNTTDPESDSDSEEEEEMTLNDIKELYKLVKTSYENNDKIIGIVGADIAEPVVNAVRDCVKSLEEQLKQQNEWFEEINLLVGADREEPAVNSVSDFVRQHQ